MNFKELSETNIIIPSLKKFYSNHYNAQKLVIKFSF